MNGLARIAMLIVAATAAACTTHNGSPTAPTPPPPGGSTQLVVTKASEGESTFQLTATVDMADGTMRDVTNAATWDSSNPGIATVTASGFVTVLGVGQADLRATYAGVSGSFHLIANIPPAYTVSGTVREAAPNTHPIGGARVQIVGGTHAITDAAGRFSFAGVAAGPLILEVTASGYQLKSQMITIAHDVDLQIDLTPAVD